ncbi:hypothetical protein NQZ68_030880 [Dissostichus eleginoides]|nr:hypothetical protein NQZ68_030880 [Dissostichus eleginoides]
MGLHVIRNEGAHEEDGPEDVGVIIEGVELLSNLRSISFGWAMLFGLIYTLNLSYPQELKSTFEFVQKVLMNLDGNKLSPKVQSLKIKMLHCETQISPQCQRQPVFHLLLLTQHLGALCGRLMKSFMLRLNQRIEGWANGAQTENCVHSDITERHQTISSVQQPLVQDQTQRCGSY